MELRRENATLREQLGLSQALPLPRIAAGVIAKDHDNLFSTITINKGARHGVRIDMPVVAWQGDLEGLVGKVVAVGRGSSQVLPLYDPSCQVSARLDESRYEGLASGQGNDRATLVMRYVKKIAADRIEYGDLVVTAGLGGLYPAGINVGRVRDIRAETYETSLTLEVEPVIDFDRLEYVFVLGTAAGAPTPARGARRRHGVTLMGRDFKAIFIAFVILAACVVLQSTILGRIAILGVRPDLALIVLVFVALRRGSMTAQVAGFASGIVEDLVSASPVGFHMLLRTLIGFLYGLFSGNVFVDPLLMPIVLTIVATILKGLISGIVSLVFGLQASGFLYFTGRLWIEAGYNALTAPFLFALLNLLKVFKQSDKEGP